MGFSLNFIDLVKEFAFYLQERRGKKKKEKTFFMVEDYIIGWGKRSDLPLNWTAERTSS